MAGQFMQSGDSITGGDIPANDPTSFLEGFGKSFGMGQLASSLDSPNRGNPAANAGLMQGGSLRPSHILNAIFNPKALLQQEVSGMFGKSPQASNALNNFKGLDFRSFMNKVGKPAPGHPGIQGIQAFGNTQQQSQANGLLGLKGA